MTKCTDNIKISRIEKRSIEVQAIAPIIELVSEKIGKAEALELLKKVNKREAFERGKSTVRTPGLNTIEELVKDVSTWGDGGEWKIEVLEETSTTYYFNVHRCLYYEKYKELGLEKLGFQLSCCRDEPFASGLNPNLKLSRTQTIMEGADFCDFRYNLGD